jgi:hypothetical protein
MLSKFFYFASTIAFLSIAFHVLLYGIDNGKNDCIMTYMSPEFHHIKAFKASEKYQLYLYREIAGRRTPWVCCLEISLTFL